jgi:uracil-DNA glycosylase
MSPGRANSPVARLPSRSAAAFLPEHPTLPSLRTAVQACRGCDLYLNATQAVFGEGPRRAEVMLVGEQPGDKEDLSGHPFLGPAGVLLDAALESAGIDRRKVYVTNAVKHFKFVRVELHKRRLQYGGEDSARTRILSHRAQGRAGVF